MLRKLVPSLGRDDRDDDLETSAACAYCGVSGTGWLRSGSCPACHLVRNLDRPRIDEEASLVWLPEISQAALNRIVLDLHCRLHPSRPLSDPGAHYVSRALGTRADAARDLLGTGRPSDLAQALTLLPAALYGDRQRALGGVRVMSAGRFFEGDADIYPQLVENWSKAVLTNPAQT